MVAIIIVSFGRLKLMERTLTSLLASEYNKEYVSITVIDNGSRSELVALLARYRDHIDNLVLLNKNKGKPYAWNLGVQIARERCKKLELKQPEYFLFCDNDLDFKPGWHEKMVSAYEEHKDLPLCALSGMRWPSHKLSGLVKGPSTEVNVVRFPPGCCMMISADAYRANGPFDTKRLIRTVDTSYFRNAQRRGYKNASIHPKTMIDHTGRNDRTWHIQTGKPKLLP